MSTTQTCDWPGASGTKYRYYVKRLPWTSDEGQDGNYIYAKVNDKNEWVPVYIGEGDLRARVSSSHHQAKCIAAKGATHVHVHLNADERARKAEEEDVLEAFSGSYKPYGCNEKLGG